MVRIRSSPSKMFHEKTDLDIVGTGRTLNVLRRSEDVQDVRSIYVLSTGKHFAKFIGKHL